MNNGIKRITAISKKELIHIFRDPRTLLIIFAMPLLQLILFGYAFDFELKKIDLYVVDQSHSQLAREFINELVRNDFFSCQIKKFSSADSMDRAFKYGECQGALIIPLDFEKDFYGGEGPAVQLIVDGSNSNTAQMIKNYFNRLLLEFNEKRNTGLKSAFQVRSALFFNESRESSYFFVPGIVALILVMISALLTSIAISKEKETGTMEQLLVSPTRSYEIIAGKVLPYILLAFCDGVFILMTGMMLFKLPFQGNVFVLVALSLLYITSALALGLLISTRAKTQQVAMMVALVVTLLPTLLLSGFVFPIVSMPFLIRMTTYLVPARYYLLMIRGVLLKGSSFFHLIEPVGALSFITLVLIVMAIKRFKIKNDL